MAAMSTMNCNSIILITENGPFADKWRGPRHPFPCGKFAGYRLLEWFGQNWGKRDNLVKPGTYVGMRKKAGENFTLIGIVGLITKVKDSPAPGKPAIYQILVHEFADQPIIPRADGDSKCHWAVLRHLGIPYTVSPFPEGIYG